METSLHLPLPGKKKLYGFLRGNPKTQPLVIFVHGLTSEMNEPKYYLGSRWFEQLGIATYRFAQVGWQQDARKLHECSVTTHGEDLDRVIAYFRRKGAQDITVVGHSMGALVILRSKKKDFDRMIFWDGSYHPATWTKNLPKVPQGYLIDCGFAAVLSEAMVKELQTVDYDAILAKIKVPSLFVYAEEGILERAARAYYRLSPSKDKKLEGVLGASHNFDEEGGIEQLLMVTGCWLRERI